jgi:hypothetical protein
MTSDDLITARVDQIVDSLQLHKYSRTLNGVRTAVEFVYGKPIKFEAVPRPDQFDTGYWIGFKDRGTVYYREIDPPFYQLHCVCHEFGHIAAGHTGCRVSPEIVGHLTDDPGAVLVARARCIEMLDDSPSINETDSASDRTQERIAEGVSFVLNRWLRDAARADNGAF